MNITRQLSAIAAVFCMAAPVSAASLTINEVDGVWSTSKPVVSGIGTKNLRWGTAVEDRRSGYNFESSATPFVVNDAQSFVLGTFTHLNFPINGVLLEAADLAVEFSIAGVAGSIQSTFSFDHFETPNQLAICANGRRNRIGANVNGCADLVKATLNEAKSEVFELDGVSYTLDISGFQYNGALLDNFWTQENRANSAQLIAMFSVVGGSPVSEVPIPGSGLILLSGLGALMLGRKRKS